MNEDGAYFRIYRHEAGREPVVVCMQWFDEPGYDPDLFVDERRFNTEADAVKALMGYRRPLGRLIEQHSAVLVVGEDPTTVAVIA